MQLFVTEVRNRFHDLVSLFDLLTGTSVSDDKSGGVGRIAGNVGGGDFFLCVSLGRGGCIPLTHGWMEVWRGLAGALLRWMDFSGGLTEALFDWSS